VQGRLARTASIVILGVAIAAVWMASRGGDSSSLRATSAFDPPVTRIVIAPGYDPSEVAVPVDDAHAIEIDRTGALLVHSGARVKRRPGPRAYQEIDGRRQDVSVRFDIAPAGDPRLLVGPYNRTIALVIELEPEKDNP
jgi:hypothetical protein